MGPGTRWLAFYLPFSYWFVLFFAVNLQSVAGFAVVDRVRWNKSLFNTSGSFGVPFKRECISLNSLFSTISVTFRI